jgi:hypothetical protein
MPFSSDLLEIPAISKSLWIVGADGFRRAFGCRIRARRMWFSCWTVCDPKHHVLGFTTPFLQRNVMKRQAAQIGGIHAGEVMR